MDGKNVLVDACIGSGKTTAIQELCNALPAYKRILYLTYNRLLKLDAKDKTITGTFWFRTIMDSLHIPYTGPA